MARMWHLGQASSVCTLVERSFVAHVQTYRIVRPLKMSWLAEACSVGAPLPADDRHALVAEALARHSDLNGTYNGDVLEALLAHDDLDLEIFQLAMRRRVAVMVSRFRGIDPVFARWVEHPAVDPDRALELVQLAATRCKVGREAARDFPSLVRAFVGRDDIGEDRRRMALALVAVVRAGT